MEVLLETNDVLLGKDLSNKDKDIVVDDVLPGIKDDFLADNTRCF